MYVRIPYFFQNYYRHNILQPVGFFVLVFLALSIGLLNRFRKMLQMCIRDRNPSMRWYAWCWFLLASPGFICSSNRHG